MAWEILLAVFGVIGVAACARCAVGLLLYPVKQVVILIPAAGDGHDLEHTVKGLRALSNAGKLEGEQILLADRGLTPEGRYTAKELCRRYPELELCVWEETDDE